MTPAEALNAAMRAHQGGQLAQAEQLYGQVLAAEPKNLQALVLAARGDPQAAMHYRRAIEMHPEFIEPYLNLALDLAAHGDMAGALASVRRSLAIKETPDNTALFTRIVGSLDAVADDLRTLVTRAATQGWGRTSDLSGVATTLVKHGQRDTRDPLLRWLLESAVICDVELERFLTT